VLAAGLLAAATVALVVVVVVIAVEEESVTVVVPVEVDSVDAALPLELWLVVEVEPPAAPARTVVVVTLLVTVAVLWDPLTVDPWWTVIGTRM